MVNTSLLEDQNNGMVSLHGWCRGTNCVGKLVVSKDISNRPYHTKGPLQVMGYE